jgi:SPOR domain/WD40-like Beta Propeller Repeat
MYRFTTLFVLLLSVPLAAQSVSELLKTAEKMEQSGNLYDAGLLQEKAWRIKPQDKSIAWAAGQNFYYAKDYRKAIDCLVPLKGEGNAFPMGGLMYARCLKSEGRYREAMEAYTLFLTNYNGSDKKTLEDIVVKEVQGCDYAQPLLAAYRATTTSTSNLNFQILPEGVNSLENEFAPIPITDDLLYFSSNFQGAAKIYRIMREGGTWTRPELAQGLPKPVEKHFGNGCFSPDGTRFFFTQCGGGVTKKAKEGRAICGIYLTIRDQEGQWTEPQKLRDYVNQPGFTSTQPYVYEQDGQEVLVFTSDRDGGQGGLDIYQCMRPLLSTDIDFSLPINLGERVNTIGDELTPFVDASSQTLYFSSNGHLGIGGLDIYKYALNKPDAPAIHLPLPYNSPADDYGYVLKKSGIGGFMVSNRVLLPQKSSTRHDDLFEFTVVNNTKYLIATLFDAEHQVSLRNIDVVLYEKIKDGRQRLLTTKLFDDGNVKFPIEVSKTYQIEVSKQGYETILVETTKSSLVADGHRFSINMPKIRGTQNSDIKPLDTKEVTMTVNSELFWVQLEAIAVAPDVESESRFRSARDLGDIKIIAPNASGLYRIIVGGFLSRDEANRAALKLRAESSFKGAFVTRS